MTSKPNVLLTGGAGYIGSHTAWRMIEAGYRPVIVDDLSTGYRRLLPPEALFIEGNAGDCELLERIFARHRPPLVIHFAARVSVEESLAEPLAYYENNLAVSLRLIRACRDHRVRGFVFSSTAAVYGIPAAVPVGEDAPLRPVTPYGRSKAMVEDLLADAARGSGMGYCALRYFNAAGADPRGRGGPMAKRATHLIKIACQAAVGVRDHVRIYGDDYDTADGTAIRDYIHVSDLADVHLRAAEYLLGGGASQVLNCGGAKGYSVRRILDLTRRLSKVDFDLRPAARREGDPPELVARCEAVREVLGWQARFSIEEIISHALAWEKTLVEEGFYDP